MPRYFFNTRIGEDLISDSEGVDLRDADQAWDVARLTIRDLLKVENSQPDLLHAVLEVTDVAGNIILEFPFSEALLELPVTNQTRH